ncbi:MAG: helix-turn-helix transcriptional regulator [Dysgonomonas sp.]
MSEQDVNHRIKLVIKNENLTIKSFSDKIGVAVGSINNMFSRGTKPSYDLIQKIKTAFPQYSSDWLLMGIGSMLYDYETQKKQLADIIANPIDIDFTGESYKTNPSLTALIKIGDKFYSANRLSELEDIVKEIKKQL